MSSVGRLLWLTLAAVLAGCAGPAPATDPGRQSGTAARPAVIKRITIGIMSEPPSLANSETNPRTTIGSLPGVEELQELVHVGLVNLDNQGAARPLLAQAVPSIENGLWTVAPDGRMRTTWRLRADAAWHDGESFTVDDLVFTAQVKRDREVPIFHSASLDLIDDVVETDAGTVTVSWKAPLFEADLLFSKFLAIPLPRHLLASAYGEDKSSLASLPYWAEGFVGTGPYRVRQWLPGRSAVLEANEMYALGRPKIDEIEVRFIAGPDPMMVNVLAGAVDFPIGRGIDLEQALSLQQQRADLSVAFSPTSLSAIYPQFVNPTPPVVEQLAFRRAALHAIDREELNQVMTGGRSQVAHSIVHPDAPDSGVIRPSVVLYDYDPRTASQLITGLGYSLGPDSIFRDADGQRLTVEIRATAQVANGKAIFPVAQYWQRAGIAVEPLIVPVQRVSDREYRATFPSFEYTSGRNGLDSGRLRLFHSAAAGLSENRFEASGNYARYMSPVLDDLIERYVASVPRGERMQVLARIVQHQTENVTLLGLFYSLSPVITSSRVINVAQGLDNTVASNAPLWDVQD